MPTPDIVLFNGSIVTLDPALPTAQAVLIRAGRIAAVGDAAQVRAAARPGYEIIDLAGRSALPGLCDAHIHLLWTARMAAQVNLEGAASLAEALERVRVHAASLPPQAWVLGYGWDHSLWNHRWPTAADLDQVTGGRPALLSRKDLHSACCNTAALQLAGLAADSADPPGGSLGRSASGELSGMLFEHAIQLVQRLIPTPTAADDQRTITALIHDLLAAGITSVHAPEGPDCMAAVGALYHRGELNMRVLHHLHLGGLDAAIALGLRSGIGDEWLRIGGVKIFSDGSLGSATAHMLEPYEGMALDDPASYGMAMFEPAELDRLVARAIAHGISVTVHAIGDAANRNVLNAIDQALRFHLPITSASGPRQPDQQPAYMAQIPNRIEHAQIVNPHDVRRFAELGVIASVQPVHATADMVVADQLWGERSRYAYAWRTLIDAGVVLACGSDAPVESWNPWWGIHAAVTRQQRGGVPSGGWYPEQRLSLDEALWGYTVGPAIASGELAQKGTLTAGKLADVIVVDRDLSAADPADLADVQVDYTFVGGMAVMERG